MKVGIINMNTNNINCFIKILKRLGYDYKVITCYNDYDESKLEINKLIIPGIGNYKYAMDYLIENNTNRVIKEHLEANKKVLAICIGMQILTSFGMEGSISDTAIINGLDIINNTITIKLECDDILPHIGWNTINLTSSNNYSDKFFNGIDVENSDYYFVHSYVVNFDKDKDKDAVKDTYKDTYKDKLIIGKSHYGNKEFISLIKTDNILALQFHPEKSGQNGIKLISRFLEW